MNAVDPTGMATVVRLRAYSLGSVAGYSYGHAFVEYRDTETGEVRISRAGPSSSYPGGASAAITDRSYKGVTMLAGDSPARQNVDYGQPGTVDVSTATVGSSIDKVSAKLSSFNELVNASKIEYKPRSQNSNTYAGNAFEHVTGQAASNGTDIGLPGLSNDLPLRSDKGMSAGNVQICSGMGAQKGGCQ